MAMKYDFSGYATKNDLRCADGRTIRKNAFIENDGKTVPIVWSHDHKDPDNVLGHALLENRDDGVYCYGVFNDTPKGQNSKKLVQHGDVKYLSIYANQLKQNGGDVVHGMIREVSLVLAGANPGAVIDYPILSHSGEEVHDEAIIYMSDDGISISHSELDEDEKEEDMAKNNELQHEDSNNDETIEDVFNTLSEKQKNAVYAIIGAALEDDEAEHSDDDGEDFYEGDDNAMKHNVFDTDMATKNVLSHADGAAIVSLAKESGVGTLKTAMNIYENENDTVLAHDAASSGFDQDTTHNGNITWLFPEYKDVRPGAPELVTYDQGWVTKVIGAVHKSPISRIRTGQVDIRNIEELRARGYKKGKQKQITGNFTLARRTTDPTTVYVKSQLHRDDIIDITDFDYVQYLYNIDRLQLNEELATAILFGDGRDESSDDKIAEDKIRPVWTDDELYTIHYDIDEEGARSEIQGIETDSYFGDNYVRAEAMINACLYSREQYKGSGQPDMFIAPHELNIMLLARDRNGRRIYSSKAELAAAFNVGNIFTIEQLGGEGKSRTDGEGASAKTKKLLALIVNLSDYSLGATKGGEITHFTQFDIDFNQQKSLLETRCSGALTRIKSAIAIEEDITA